MRVWNGFAGSEQGPVAVSFEHGNEPPGSKKGGVFIEKLSDYASWSLYTILIHSFSWTQYLRSDVGLLYKQFI
jgi:hypothetical protein